MVVQRSDINEPLLPPFFSISANHQGAFALIAAVILIVVAGLAVLVKLNLSVATFRKVRLDDVALSAALVCKCAVFTR